MWEELLLVTYSMLWVGSCDYFKGLCTYVQNVLSNAYTTSCAYVCTNDKTF